MKKLILTLLVGFLASITFAQNEKNVVVDANAEIRKVSGFNKVEVSGAIDLFISQGTEEAAAVSATTDEIRSRIKTEVRDGILYISLDGKGLNWKLWSNNKMKAYITFVNLNGIEASGACNVKTSGKIKSSNLTLEMSGASDFNGEVEVEKLRVDANGASNYKLFGTATVATLDASGACNIKAYDLKTEQCKATASGASNIWLTVQKELNANASGGSNILYKGEGLIKNISSSGGASVKSRNE